MADQKTSYVVSIFDTAAKAWQTILTTTSKDEAEAMVADIADDDKVRIEEFTPRPPKRR